MHKTSMIIACGLHQSHEVAWQTACVHDVCCMYTLPVTLMLGCLAVGLDDADMLRHSSARSDSEASMGSPLAHCSNPRDASGTSPASLSCT